MPRTYNIVYEKAPVAPPHVMKHVMKQDGCETKGGTEQCKSLTENSLGSKDPESSWVLDTPMPSGTEAAPGGIIESPSVPARER